MTQPAGQIADMNILCAGILQSVVAAREAETRVLSWGCVDRRKGQFCPEDGRELNAIVNLESVVLPNERFAWHVGRKVAVRGPQNLGRECQVSEVRRIEAAGETFAPQTASEGRK